MVISKPTKIVAVAIVWQFASLMLARAYDALVAPLVAAAFFKMSGSPQANFGLYARLDTYVGLLCITASAMVASLWLSRILAGPRPRNPFPIAAAAGWEGATMALLIVGYEFDLPGLIRQCDWRIFGVPADFYGFRNFVWPRLLAWLLCTMPVAIVSLAILLRDPEPAST